MTFGRIDFYSLTRSILASSPATAGRVWPDLFSSDDWLVDDALIYLTEEHEYDHFATLLACPLGLLLWRMESVHVVDGLWFGSRLEEAGVTEAPGGLDRWFANVANRQRIINAVADGLISPHNPPADPQDALETMDDFLAGLRTIRATRDLMIGLGIKQDSSFGAFLQGANEAYRYMAKRSALPTHHWMSRKDPDTPLYGDPAINALHLIEAIARLRELDVMHYHSVPAGIVAEWERRMIQGRYAPVIRILRDAGLESIPARNLCMVALCGVLDPALVAKDQTALFVEDELPWLRLHRLLGAYNSASMDPDDLRTHHGLEDLCEAAGLTSPAAMFERAKSTALVGDSANWNPMKQVGGPIYALYSYLEIAWLDTLDWFQRSYARQAAAWKQHLDVVPDMPAGPVVYTDIATLRPQSSSEDALMVEIMRWRRRLLSEYVRAFVEGKPVEPAAKLAQKVESGLVKYSFSSDVSTQIVDTIFDRRPLYEDQYFGDFVQPRVIANSVTFVR